MVLVRNVETCLDLYKSGFPLKSIQIGELPNGPGREPVYKAVSFSKEEVEKLKDLYDGGIEILLHIVPDNPSMEFEKVLKKFGM